MTAWVLVLVFAFSGGATSVAVDMPSPQACLAAKNEAQQSDRFGPSEGSLKVAICVQRS